MKILKLITAMCCIMLVWSAYNLLSELIFTRRFTRRMLQDLKLMAQLAVGTGLGIYLSFAVDKALDKVTVFQVPVTLLFAVAYVLLVLYGGVRFLLRRIMAKKLEQ